MSKKSRFDNYPPGDIIADALKRKKMQQNELAAIVNMSAATINDIVKGKRTITTNICIRVSLALGLDPFELMRSYSDYAVKMELQRFMSKVSNNPAEE